MLDNAADETITADGVPTDEALPESVPTDPNATDPKAGPQATRRNTTGPYATDTPITQEGASE